MSLHQNIIDQKTMKAEFYNKIAFVARKRLQPAFTQWVDAVNDQLMEEKADEFYNNRKM